MSKHRFVLTCALLSVTAVAAEPAASGKGTSPGKPRAPLLLELDTGDLQPGVDRQVTLSVRALSSCDRVTTTVRGRSGAELTDTSLAERRHGPLRSRALAEHRLRARVPAGAAGELVVIARCEKGDQVRDLVQVFPFAARGPDGELPARKQAPLGRVETDESGRRVHVLRSAQ